MVSNDPITLEAVVDRPLTYLAGPVRFLGGNPPVILFGDLKRRFRVSMVGESHEGILYCVDRGQHGSAVGEEWELVK